MATFYMNENHPSLIMAEQSPGPGWTKAKRTDGHRGNQDATPVASLPALVLGVASELAKSEELRRQVFAESEPKPVKSFGEVTKPSAKHSSLPSEPSGIVGTRICSPKP